MEKKLLTISVVVTVFNEQSTVVDLVSSLSHQSLRPKEIIIVDGGSKDNTYAILKKLSTKHSNLHVFQTPGNRSVGRNFGVAKSSGSVIAFTDAGCIPEPDWLQYLIRPFSSPSTQVVSGYYRGIATNVFQQCLIPYVLVMPDQAGRTEFFPATRSMAIRRQAWNQSGGFDEKLSHNEDYAYAHWLKKMGFTFVFAKEAVVNWLPRKNLSQAFWMFTRFAIGDAQAGIIRPKVKILVTRYIVFIYLVFLAVEIHSLFPAVVLIMLAYLIWSIVKNYRYVGKFPAFFWLPVLQISSDLAVIFGTLIGIMSRP